MGGMCPVPVLVFQIEKERGPDGTMRAFARMTGTLGADNNDHFRRVVSRLMRKGVRHLVLDLSGVTRVDLKGLGALEETCQLLEDIGGTMSVVGTEMDGLHETNED